MVALTHDERQRMDHHLAVERVVRLAPSGAAGRKRTVMRPLSNTIQSNYIASCGYFWLKPGITEPLGLMWF